MVIMARIWYLFWVPKFPQLKLKNTALFWKPWKISCRWNGVVAESLLSLKKEWDFIVDVFLHSYLHRFHRLSTLHCELFLYLFWLKLHRIFIIFLRKQSELSISVFLSAIKDWKLCFLSFALPQNLDKNINSFHIQISY